MRTVVSYDISNDRRRRKVATILEGYGYPVQYGVFECDLNAKKLAELKSTLKPLVREKEWESIRFYSLYTECAQNGQVLGKDLREELQPTVVI